MQSNKTWVQMCRVSVQVERPATIGTGLFFTDKNSSPTLRTTGCHLTPYEVYVFFSSFPTGALVLNSYLRRDETRLTSIPLSEFVAMKLVEPFTNCRRNITTDNFFTTSSLAAKLLAKRTTLVGTMRANRRELPALAKTTKDNSKLLSTMTYKSNDCTLTIYKSKPRKKVAISSTKRKTVKIKNNRKKTRETISYCDKTKFGVDIVDQMARKYSVKSKCNRWPVQVFFNILDLAGINSWILYQETTGLELSRQSFLLRLADELVTEYLEFCEEEKENQREGVSSSSNNNSQSRKKCQIRLRAGNKTTQTCIICKKFVRGKCTKEKPILCKKCNWSIVSFVTIKICVSFYTKSETMLQIISFNK
ncbi:uncharacterized protein LOC143152895 [Ptiloglossa arizonensis]|uniref:uncharacterized protein LOC143152895 n=1 Tax=Ptiloglossa arizonensis TaxID=3350558 RepID=UPI003FA13ED4